MKTLFLEYKVRVFVLSLLALYSFGMSKAWSAYYETKFEIDKIVYKTISEKEVEVYENKGWNRNIVIPETVNHRDKSYTVTAIGERAFYGYYGESYDYKKIESISLPETITVIRDEAFAYGTFKEIKLPSSLESIGKGSFAICEGLSAIELPENLREIGDYAFYECSFLKSIKIGSSLEKIGDGAFLFCVRLNNIEVSDSNPYFVSLDNVLYDKALTKIFRCAVNKTEITLPNTIKNIGYAAFDQCLLLSGVNLPESVETIEGYAFYNCESLKKIIIPQNVKTIGNNAFCACLNLESITFSEGLEEIGKSAFAYCAPKAIHLPTSVKIIGHGAFDTCLSLKSINIPGSVELIEEFAFSSCMSLETIEIPESVTEIKAGILDSCKSLKSVKLPEGITYIGRVAFSGCSSLEIIKLPASLSVIDEYAFDGCSSLKEIYCHMAVAPDANGCFGDNTFNIYRNSELFVPASSIDSYKSTNPWRYFKNIKSLEESGIDYVINPEENYFRVFDLNGRNILNTTYRSEIDNLTPGIYIINGKKTVIGK